MFGLMESDGMEWNEVIYNYVPLFGFAKKKDDMQYLHPIPLIHAIFHSPQFWVYVMK
jgi:hypothetical protein